MKREKKESRDDKERWEGTRDIIDELFKKTKDRREKMTKYIQAYRGVVWDVNELDDKESKIFYNMIFAAVSSIAPLITDSKPITTVVPKVPYMEKAGQAYTKALKYAWDTQDIQMLLYKGVIWSMLCGFAVYKVYFEPTLGDSGDLCIELVDPREFFVAPGYEEIWKAPYCGVVTRKPISWVKQVFPDAEIKDDVEFLITESDKKDTDREFKYAGATAIQNESSFVKVYEVWSKDDEVIFDEKEDGEEKEEKLKYPHGKLEYFTSNQYLGCMPAPDKHGLPPYVELMDYYNPGMFTAIGEADQILDLNKEMNLQLQAISGWTRRVAKKNYTVDASANVDVEMIKETFEQGGNFYAVDKQFNSTRPVVEPIEVGILNQDIYKLVTLIPTIVEDVTGINDVQKGIAGKRERQSASELAILAEAANTRTRQKIRNLEWTIKHIAYILIKLMQENYTDDRYSREIKDESVYYRKFSSRREFMDKAIRDDRVMEKLKRQVPDYDSLTWHNDFMSGVMDNVTKNFSDEELMSLSDYAEYCQAMEGTGPLDPVYFNYDIEIQTNSTLPLDKQSLANLMLRLYQLKGTDRQSLLETLQIPNGKAIDDRMKEREQEAAKAKQGQPPQRS